jgi:hypothetical protein
VRALRLKHQHAVEEDKAKWGDLAKEKAAGATATRKIAELEAAMQGKFSTLSSLCT